MIIYRGVKMSDYLSWCFPNHEALAVLHVEQDILREDVLQNAHCPFLVGFFYGIDSQLLLVHIMSACAVPVKVPGFEIVISVEIFGRISHTVAS